MSRYRVGFSPTQQWEWTWDCEGGTTAKDRTQGGRGQNATSMAWRVTGFNFTLSLSGFPSGSEAFLGGCTDVLQAIYDPPDNVCKLVWVSAHFRRGSYSLYQILRESMTKK